MEQPVEFVAITASSPRYDLPVKRFHRELNGDSKIDVDIFEGHTEHVASLQKLEIFRICGKISDRAYSFEISSWVHWSILY